MDGWKKKKFTSTYRGREVKAQYEACVRFVDLSKDFNRRGVESDTDFQFYSAELDPAPDKDYEGEVSPITLKRAPSPPLRTTYTAIPFYVYFVLFSDRWPIPSRAILPTTRPPRMITGQDFLPFSPFL